MAKLTEKQRKFVLYYEGNATEAATKAGYSPKTAYSMGPQLLKKVEIQKALQQRRNAEPKPWGRAELYEFWQMMAKEAEGDNNRLKASELLAKAEAMFVQKVQVEDVTAKEKIDIFEGAIKGLLLDADGRRMLKEAMEGMDE